VPASKKCQGLALYLTRRGAQLRSDAPVESGCFGGMSMQ
jgi:hypothetical protein